jgi:DNA-binding LacI/PurR family transcriptional regulator
VRTADRHIAYVDHVTDRANDARLPEEVRLQGYVDAMTRRGLEADIDTFTSSLDPISLTTVDQSGFTLGTTAGRLLVEGMGDGKTPSLLW